MTLDISELEKYFKDLENQNKQIKNDLVHLCWYMRGSVSYEDAHYLTTEDRVMMSDLVKENIENVKKTKLPLL